MVTRLELYAAHRYPGMARGRKPSVTRERILNTASALFRKAGIRDTAIGKVAKATGVAKGSLLKHFPSKENLAMAYLKQEESLIISSLDCLFIQKKTTSGITRDIFHWIVQLFSSERGRHGLAHFNVLVEYPDPKHTLHKEGRIFREKLSKSLLSILEFARINEPHRAADKLLRTIDAVHVASIIGGKRLDDFFQELTLGISNKSTEWPIQSNAKILKFLCKKCQSPVEYFSISTGINLIEGQIDKIRLAGFEKNNMLALLKLEVEANLQSVDPS